MILNVACHDHAVLALPGPRKTERQWLRCERRLRMRMNCRRKTWEDVGGSVENSQPPVQQRMGGLARAACGIGRASMEVEVMEALIEVGASFPGTAQPLPTWRRSFPRWQLWWRRVWLGCGHGGFTKGQGQGRPAGVIFIRRDATSPWRWPCL